MSAIMTLLILAQSMPYYADACLSTTTRVATTTTALCCTALSTSNPVRVTAPAGTPGAALDECAVLRRIQRGSCPSTAQIVCSAARNMQVSQVILQFLNGNTVVASATGATRASATITCTSSGWRVTNTAGTLVAYTSVSCTQQTISGPDFSYYYSTYTNG
uniref:C6 domain-containing protein n=1 Tax=Panagrolaimus sp. JU765 TaxID=591449 RepID=A0AC34PZM3_9BILA